MHAFRTGSIGAGLWATTAFALLATSTPGYAAIEEVVVSVRKRDENLQQVPISVTAMPAEELERKGITDLEGVIRNTSSLILDQGFSPADQRVVIRGLSPQRGRQNVAVLVDDIDISSESVSTAGGSLLINPKFFDLERVEVVKGPQNALYGRAAFNGAINYITRKPGDEFEARAGTDIGSNGQLDFSGSVMGPLSDNVSAGITASTWNHDGFYSNSITGDDVGGKDGTSVSGTLVWDVTDKFKATARVDRLDDSFEASPYTVMPFNAFFPAVPNAPVVGGTGSTPVVDVFRGVKGYTPDAKEMQVAVSEDPRTCNDPSSTAPANGRCNDYPGTDRDITRGTLTLDWDADAVLVKSLTHVASAETLQQEGAFGVSVSAASAVGEIWFQDDTDLFSQELRFVSNGEGPINWAGGILYWNEDSDSLDGSSTCFNSALTPCAPYIAAIRDVFPGNPPGVVPLNPDVRFRETEHWSVYGLVEWQFLEAWQLSFEGRQTWEDVDVGGPNVDNGIWDPSGFRCFPGSCPEVGPGTAAPAGPTTVAGVNEGSLDDDFFAPKVTLTWTPTDDLMSYFSWARAYKPEGFSTLNSGVGAFVPDLARFDQEKLDVWELGGKSEWFEDRLQVNGAVFFQDFKNKQVSTQVVDESTTPPTLVGRTVNAGAAEIWGVELDMTWIATDNLSFNVSGTWLDAEYKDYTVFSTNAVAAAYLGACNPPFTQPPATRAGCTLDYAGKTLEDVPEWSWVGGARYQDKLVGETDWFVDGDFQFQDDRFEDDDNLLIFPAYWLFNFRLGVTNDSWDILAYVDNAFDDDTIKTGFANGSTPNFQRTFRFENEGVLLMPDRRQYGMRVNYRFGR